MYMQDNKTLGTKIKLLHIGDGLACYVRLYSCSDITKSQNYSFATFPENIYHQGALSKSFGDILGWKEAKCNRWWTKYHCLSDPSWVHKGTIGHCKRPLNEKSGREVYRSKYFPMDNWVQSGVLETATRSVSVAMTKVSASFSPCLAFQPEYRCFGST